MLIKPVKRLRQKLERTGDLRLCGADARWVHLSKLIQISILLEALLVRGWIHVKTFNQRACPADLIWTLPFQDISFSKKYFTYQPKNCALDKKQILLLHSQLATP